ncbi:MAG: hypothetical protein AAFO77_00470 [Pseudomonadota bacterium]
MSLEALTTLRDRLQGAEKLDAALTDKVAPLIAQRTEKLGGSDVVSQRLLKSTDSALQTIGVAFPDWDVDLQGSTIPVGEPEWKCEFRETRGDDEQLVGVGHGAGIRLSILSAIVHLEIMRAQGYR